MKKIIDQMRQIVSAKCNEYGIKDFETYDAKWAAETTEPFFFGVRESGTTFCSIGNTAMQQTFRKSVYRFQLFREESIPICSILYYKNWKDYDVYFFDGYELLPIRIDDVAKTYFNIWGNAINELKRDYAQEYEVRNKKLSLRIQSEKVDQIRAMAKEMGDTTLEECIERLISKPRLSINHWVELSGEIGSKTDIRWYRWYFDENGNEVGDINGGICFHEEYTDKNGNVTPAHWSIHT